MKSYPLRVFDERELPANYQGRVFVWDIDKTYLNTRFSSLKGLARIPLEFAIDKRAIVGMPEVLKGIRRGPGEGWALHPVYFVSASPHQLRAIIARKMLLDGVQPDGFIFKDWGKVLLGRRPGRLWEQLGFKLCALLTARLKRPDAEEFLFGDDTEDDAEAFSIYSRLIDGSLTYGEARAVLQAAGVKPYDQEIILAIVDRLGAHQGKVSGIFIHLADASSPARFERFGEKVKPVRDALQLALALLSHDALDLRSVRMVADALQRAGQFASAQLHDAVDRGLCQQEALEKLSLDF